MNKYILLLIVLLIILISTGYAFADTDEVQCNDNWATLIKLLCWVEEIHEQNNEIIDKLDWNNCAMKYKMTKGYYGATGVLNEYGNGMIHTKVQNANNYEELVELCGEMP